MSDVPDTDGYSGEGVNPEITNAQIKARWQLPQDADPYAMPLSELDPAMATGSSRTKNSMC